MNISRHAGTAHECPRGVRFTSERYFVALIRMYDQSVELVLNLTSSERLAYVERLDKLRSRARTLGCGVGNELNSLWYAASLDEQ